MLTRGTVAVPATVRAACLLALGLTSSLFASAPDTSWTRAIGGHDYDECLSICQTSDGTYIAAGSMAIMATQTADALLLKLDADGDTLWTRTYGGQYVDDACAVQQTSDGGYILAGTTGVSNLPLYAPWLIKTDAGGSALWTRTYGLGYGNGVQQTFDGGYVLVGYQYGNGVLLVRTDSNGDTLWTKLYNGTDTVDYGYAVRQTPDSGYAVLAGGSGIWFLKTDANGDTLWTRRYWGDSSGNARTSRNALTATTDGGFAIVASTAAGLETITRLIRLNSSGDTLWTKEYPGESNYGLAIQQAYDGGFIIAGYGTGDGNDVWLLRTDAGGDTLWTKTIGGDGSESGSSVWQTSDSGYIVAGTTTSYGGTKAYFVKLEPDHGGGIEDDTDSQGGISQFQRDPSQATVYDINGRMVGRVPHFAAATPGRLSALLAGRLAPGVYFIHVEAGKSTHRLKTVFVR